MTDTIELIGKRYLIQDELGRGGMGIVHRATDRLTQQTIALKQVTIPSRHLRFDTMSDTDDVRLALAQEFKILSSMRHPNIISVLDYGFDMHGQPFFTMELLDKPLNIVEAGKITSVAQRMQMVIQTLQALRYLHRRGIIHRDLKPGNVMVQDDQVKVLDFGLAQGTEHLQDKPSETTAGTIAYMAPELLKGAGASAASDLYAVGVIAYQLLTGRHPFQTENLQDLMMSIIKTQPDLTLVDIEAEIDSDITIDQQQIIGNEATQSARSMELDLEEEATVIHVDRSAVSDEEVKPQRVSREVLSPLAQIIGRLLAKTPAERYTNARDVIRDLCRATGISIPTETEAIRESYLQSAAFVGRETEFNRLHNALLDAQEGTGTVWLVAGESGVGKSRLVDELRTQALVEGVLAVRGQAVTEGSAPYSVWRDVLRNLSLHVELSELEASVLKLILPDIDVLLERRVKDAPELDLQSSQSRLLLTIEDVLRRLQHPILIILEDLQWVQESLRVLNRINQVVAELPILIVGTYRNDERPNLPDELPDANVLKLDRLEEYAIADLSESMLGEIGRKDEIVGLLHRETEGNVFFIVEVVRALAEEAGQLDEVAFMTLPKNVFAEGIRAVVKRRLDRVPEDARLMLRVAAVAGRHIDLKVLKIIQEYFPVDQWLTACSNSSVLEVQDDRWWFAHDKLREALLAELSDDERVTINRQVAEAFETAYPDNSAYYAKLTYHWGAAGVIDKEQHYATLAGKQSLKVGAYKEAVVFFQRATELARQTDIDKVAHGELERLLGEAYYGLGFLVEARQHLVQALELFGRKHPSSKVGLILRLLQQLLRQMFHRLTIERFNLWQKPHADSARFQGAALTCERLNQIHFFRSEKLETVYYVIQGLNLAERTGLGGAEIGRSYATMSTAMGLVPLHGAAEAYARRADEVARNINQIDTVSWISEIRGVYEGGRGKFADAEHYLHRCIDLAEQAGDRRRWNEGTSLLCYTLHYQSKWDEELNYVNQLYASVDRYEDIQVRTVATIAHAEVLLKRGDLGRALQLAFERKPNVEETHVRNNAIRTYGIITQAYLRKGDLVNARQYAEQLGSLIDQSSATAYFIFPGYAGLAEFYLSEWERDPSSANKTLAQKRLKTFGTYARVFEIGKPRFLTYQSWFAWLDGNSEKATSLGEQAIEKAAELGMPYDLGVAHALMGRFMHGDAATQHLAKAREIWEDLGAEYELERISLYA